MSIIKSSQRRNSNGKTGKFYLQFYMKSRQICYKSPNLAISTNITTDGLKGMKWANAWQLIDHNKKLLPYVSQRYLWKQWIKLGFCTSLRKYLLSQLVANYCIFHFLFFLSSCRSIFSVNHLINFESNQIIFTHAP